MTEALGRVDAVVEVLDARIPNASSNPMLRDIIHKKPKMVVLYFAWIWRFCADVGMGSSISRSRT